MDQLTFLDGAGKTISPIRKQYLDIKRRHPDAVLLFRLGDFYETFDDDARLISSELDIVLTSRDMGRGDKVPLAGIPYHAAEGYIARLLARGHRIAVCEQLSPTPVKGLVPREVVRVITPGTLVEDSLLPARSNNYLAALVATPDGAGLGSVDISTGDFAVVEFHGSSWEAQLAAELERLCPAECLVPGTKHQVGLVERFLPPSTYVTQRDDASFAASITERALKEHFGVATLDGFGLSDAPLATRAAGALIGYVRETQPAALGQLETVQLYSVDRFMRLDAAARRHLELTANVATGTSEGSLLWALDRTRTPMGARLLRRWLGQPLLDLEAINARLNSVEEMAGSVMGRAELAQILAGVGDLERLASRASQQSLMPRECLGICRTLRSVPRLLASLAKRMPRTHERVGAGLDPCEQVVELIENTVDDEPTAVPGEGVIRPGRSSELDDLRSITRDTRQWIASLERQERERTGVRSLKIGFNKVFGYYIEVTRPNLDAPADEYARMKSGATTVAEYLDSLGYQRKQTIANGERFVTPELKEQELRLVNAQAEIEALERHLYAELLGELAIAASRLRDTARALAEVDVYLSLGEVAATNRYARPRVDESSAISLRAARHPVVERSMPAGQYIPNDCDLDCDGTQIAVLTGPNMAGKSTYILGVALCVVLAQVGSFVPADAASIGLVDRVFTRVGAQHDVSSGKSTFLVEMAETANILHNATRRSLVVLDEVGRGTSTYDGMAIARAVIESLHDESRLGCRTLFATHYHELTELEAVLPRVRNLRMDVLEEGDRVVFLHRVVPGGADRSYGIHVAQLAGVPRSVVRRAEEILSKLEARRDSAPLPQRTGPSAQPAWCLDLIEDLAELDVDSMTPLEALTRLHDLKRRFPSGKQGGPQRGN